MDLNSRDTLYYLIYKLALVFFSSEVGHFHKLSTRLKLFTGLIFYELTKERNSGEFISARDSNSRALSEAFK